MPRALTELEIQLKKDFIINHALSLFESTTFKTFLMDDLAAICGVSKGILFRYFSSKEELFLQMLLRTYKETFQRFEQEVQNKNEMSVDELKEVIEKQFVVYLDSKSAFVRLLALKGTLLDEKQSYDTMLDFKNEVNSFMISYAQNIMFKVPTVKLEDLLCLFRFQVLLCVGFSNTNIKEQGRSIVEDNDLDSYQIDCYQMTTQAFQLYIKQVLHK